MTEPIPDSPAAPSPGNPRVSADSAIHRTLPPERTVPRRALPFGGAVEVARSYLAVHVRNPWTGRCRSCGDPFPCPDRQAALAIAGALDPPPLQARRLRAARALTALTTLALLAVALVTVTAVEVASRW